MTSLRKAAKTPYPTPYAVTSADTDTDSKDPLEVSKFIFNCAQRAHANYMENHPSTVLSILIAGIRYPVASSIIGGIWMICRVLYAVGYTRRDKKAGKGRAIGAGMWPAQFGLYGMAGWVGISMLRG